MEHAPIIDEREARAPTAAALVIGDEILSGKVQEANIPVLARALRDLGVLLRRVVVVMDDVDTIAHEVRELSNTHDWLFTSGGVGPTHDDVTVAAVAKAFGVTVVSSPTAPPWKSRPRSHGPRFVWVIPGSCRASPRSFG
jgi:molybdenum cofactor synthesis domain-containing protein